MKGLAIASVICLHTLTPRTLGEIGAHFHIWQAVPVFLFLLGLNGASSLRRHGGRGLRELYSRDYLSGRVDRIAVPFLAAFVGTLLVALLTHVPHAGAGALAGDLLTGVFPISGPGNYFVTLLFEFTVVLPLLYWALLRWPVATLLGCLALNVGYELLEPHVGLFKSYPYAGGTFFARFLFLVALGGFCAVRPSGSVLRSRWLWLGAPLGIVYLALEQANAAVLSSTHLSLWGNPLLSAIYPACLVLLGIAFLPVSARGFPARAVALLGRASYHIFLLQIAWFGFAVWHASYAHSLGALFGNLAVTLTAGVAFYELMARVPLPSATRLLARRQAALAEA